MIVRFVFIQILFFVTIGCQAQTIASIEDRSVSDTTFVNLKAYADSFIFEMKYATDDNFLKSKVYDCAECFLRYKTVKKLIEANQKFLKLGYRIKIFDCYRPLDVQKKMWKLVPNPIYVADPAKGSIHNRGGAVDLTLVDNNGKEVDMGTPFDHFGIESAHDYKGVSYAIKSNRALLKSVMESCQFLSFKSEWWHYNLKTDETDKVSNFKWECN
jgi:D-alanyl-D-alanine dipeptidase